MDVLKSGRSNAEVDAASNRLTTVLLIIYLIVLYWILLFKLGARFSNKEARSVNFIPFSEPLVINGKVDAGEMILNVVVFVPLGMYAGFLFKRWSFGKKLFFFFLVSLLVEGLQYLLAVGVFDITDIITNTSGGIIGLLLYALVEKVFSNPVRAQRLFNVVATVGTVLFLSFLLLLKMEMLPLRYR